MKYLAKSNEGVINAEEHCVNVSRGNIEWANNKDVSKARFTLATR
jgi:hypothetical protein